MDNTLLQQLAKRLNLTNFEPEIEPYILTSEDEETIIQNAIKASKDWHLWKMNSLNMPEGDIELKMAEIDWETKIDREALLKSANTNKNYELWQKENRRKEKEDEERKRVELQKLWSATTMYRLMVWTSENRLIKKLVVNEYNKHLISALCFFLSNDERFEKELGYSFNKGICIRGISGLGKTHLVRCLEKNELNPIQVMSMIEITEEVKAHGEYNINLGLNKVLYLDDVGTEEPIVNHYGTKITFFKNFIESMYLREKDFSKLIISTNNSAAEIEDRYGFRVRSRMKDMFNIIDVDGKDMRG